MRGKSEDNFVGWILSFQLFCESREWNSGGQQAPFPSEPSHQPCHFHRIFFFSIISRKVDLSCIAVLLPEGFLGHGLPGLTPELPVRRTSHGPIISSKF